MKTNIALLLLLTLLVGCGKVELFPVPHFKVDEKETKKKSSKKSESSSCTTPLIRIYNDRDIKFYRKTVDAVLEDMRSQKNFQMTKFWSALKPETRSLLNYELNFYLLTNPKSRADLVYEATGYFFTHVRKEFDENTTYQLKDKNNEIYSFKVRAVATKNKKRYSYRCGEFEPTALSGYKDDTVVKISDLKEVYECRTDKFLMVLMEMKDSFFLMTDKTLYHLPTKNLNIEERKRRTSLTYSSRDINFDLKVKSRKSEIVKEWEGKRTFIDFESPLLRIVEEGGCNGIL